MYWPQIYADVGAFDEEDGQTGLAHLLEHMAFKGTPRIGSRDYRQAGRGCCVVVVVPCFTCVHPATAAAKHVGLVGCKRGLGALHCRRQEAPLLEALDETFYELQGAGSGPRAPRLQQQLEALQRQVGNCNQMQAGLLFGAALPCHAHCECHALCHSMGGSSRLDVSGCAQHRYLRLLAQAAALSIPNAYGALLQQEGGVGLNAATSHDATK